MPLLSLQSALGLAVIACGIAWALSENRRAAAAAIS